MSHSPRRSPPAVLSLGFRPFFLLGALFAVIMVALWVPWFLGFIEVPTAFAPIAWHAHELLFGFVPAIVAGFLLTAVPNWTGRPPVAGWPLAGLVLVWLVGR
ncbi:MAG: NnrS family protein, partial [Rhizobiales bacterium]|nr:NnrS family protein [Hyphomicrobiales bacterium]